MPQLGARGSIHAAAHTGREASSCSDLLSEVERLKLRTPKVSIDKSTPWCTCRHSNRQRHNYTRGAAHSCPQRPVQGRLNSTKEVMRSGNAVDGWPGSTENERLFLEVGGLAITELDGAPESHKWHMEALGGVCLSIEAVGLPLLFFICAVPPGIGLCTSCQGRSLNGSPRK